MENKWYKYKGKIFNLSIYSKFKIMKTAYPVLPYDIVFEIERKEKETISFETKEEAEQEFENIFNILTK